MGRWNRLVVLVLGVLLVSWGGPAASAFWSSVSSNGAAAKADALAQGNKPSVAVGQAGNVAVTWAASTTAAGKPVSGYTIARYSSATGGTSTAGSGTCAVVVTALTCTDVATTGSWYYVVTPTVSLWQGAESLRSAVATVDATAPVAPTVTAPAYVVPANVSNVPVSGTAEANSTVVLTVTDVGAAHTVTQTRTANSSGAWSATTLNLSTFNAGIITYSARATDAAGNTGPAGTTTSVKDTTAPTVTGVQLVNGGATPGKVEQGDKVVVTFSEALDASKICSTWTDDTVKQRLGGDNQVTVSISNSDNLTVSSTGCTLRFGTVALGGNYASGSMSFKGTSANASVLEWDPAAKTITITLGTQSGNSNSTPQSAASAKFTPSSGHSDIAGNALATSQVTDPTASRF
ncbi:hypothetical protein ACIPY2_11995 [Paenarthrobacter sp. NPDC089675]|uniref:hypothetical protein n=1 Tax=Paenarthrobacter sp. NPDC089675 TaxID=3364376 RepID=UPI00380D7C0B